MTRESSLFDSYETPQKPALFTPFSVYHMLVGVLAFTLIRWVFPDFPITHDFIIWFTVHSVYEFKDAVHPNTTNSLINSFGDTICSMFGFFVAYLFFQDRPMYLYDVLNFALLTLVFNLVIPERSS